MKKNNKGFTLVELIVVLVILAILAAILVPALLGWIDKAREKSVTNNAEAAYVATQGLVTECYGNYTDPTGFTFADANKLADIKDDGGTPTISYTCEATWSAATKTDKNNYKIKTFTYTSGDGKKKAEWTSASGAWEVTDVTP